MSAVLRRSHGLMTVKQASLLSSFRRKRGRSPYIFTATIHNLSTVLLEPRKSLSEPITLRSVKTQGSDVAYDCISYDRSASHESTKVILDDTELEVPLPLETALRALRKPADSRCLWADLLLGPTPRDRSQQAQQSRHALQNASTTIAWLGPGTARTEEAFKALKTLGTWWKQASVHGNLPSVAIRSNSEQLAGAWSYIHAQDVSQLKPDDQELWTTMMSYFESSYFNSVHTIPDLVLSRSPEVRCGASSLPWPDFVAALQCLPVVMGQVLGRGVSPTMLEAFSRVSSIDLATRRILEGKDLELMPMLRTASDMRCTDPRDYVFAMLPITTPLRQTDSKGRELQPLTADYSKSTEEVFIEASKFVIEERQDLLLWWGDRPPNGRKIKSLPSWVVDWTSPAPNSMTSLSPETGLSTWSSTMRPGRRITFEGNKLCIQAHKIDRIATISRMFTRENFRELVLHLWRTMPLPPDQSKEEVSEAFWRTLLLNVGGPTNTHAEQAPPIKEDIWPSFLSVIAEAEILDRLKCTLEELQSSKEIQERMLADPHCREMGQLTGYAQVFEDLFYRASIGRRFFTTESGRVGMTAFEEAPVEEGEDGERKTKLAASLNQFMTESDLGVMGPGMMKHFQKYLEARDPAAAARHAEIEALKEQLRGAKVGDIIVAAVGGFHPYVLRPLKDDSSEGSDDASNEDLPKNDAEGLKGDFRFVGDCYLHGMMHGESFMSTNWRGKQSWRTDIEVHDIKIV